MGMKAGRFVGTAVWKYIKDNLLGKAYMKPGPMLSKVANGSETAVA